VRPGALEPKRRGLERAWRVSVARLLSKPGETWHIERSGWLDHLQVVGTWLDQSQPVEVEAELEALSGGGVMVSGTVRFSWRAECRRCLSPAAGDGAASVRELFVADGDPETTYAMTPDLLDLEPLARDAVLLELPLAPVCRPGCKGLCPTCGRDLNESGCDCPVGERDPRWQALDVLLGPDAGSMEGSSPEA
jgi:uncharacterized protein